MHAYKSCRVLSSSSRHHRFVRRCHPPTCTAAHHLIIDGSNLLCFSRQASTDQADMLEAFSAYLDFFVLALNQCHGQSQTSRLYIIFDSPQGAEEGWRRKKNPSYKWQRYVKKEHPDSKIEKNQVFMSVASSLGFTVAVASPADEADDLIGSLASEILRSSSALVSIVSSDSDMIQLTGLDNRVLWLEILQWPTTSVINTHSPIALETSSLAGLTWLPIRLHRSSIPHAHYLPPSLYCDWLALTQGKVEAGVKGVGIRSSTDRELLVTRYPLWLNAEAKGHPLEDEKLGRARYALNMIQMMLDPSLVSELVTSPSQLAPNMSKSTLRERLEKEINISRDEDLLAMLHPSNAKHVLSAATFVRSFSANLTAQGVSHKPWHNEDGLLIDILVYADEWIIVVAPSDFLASVDTRDLRQIKRSSPSHVPSALQRSLCSQALTKIKQATKRCVSILSVVFFWEVDMEGPHP